MYFSESEMDGMSEENHYTSQNTLRLPNDFLASRSSTPAFSGGPGPSGGRRAQCLPGDAFATVQRRSWSNSMTPSDDLSWSSSPLVGSSHLGRGGVQDVYSELEEAKGGF